MKAIDLANYMTDIDENLLQQGQLALPRRKPWKRAVSVLLAAAMMACSFAVGVFAAGSLPGGAEPVGQPQTLELWGAGITLQLPDGWEDKYTYEITEDGRSCAVYVRSIYETREQEGWQGHLFSIGKYYDQPMTPREAEERSPVPARFLLSTEDGTYLMYYASDVQYDPGDPEETAEYERMYQESDQIRIIMDYVLYNDIQSCMRTLTADVITDVEGAVIAPQALAAALNNAAGSSTVPPAEFLPSATIILWLDGETGTHSDAGLRLELAHGAQEGLVRVHYCGTGLFYSENPYVDGTYLHDYDQWAWFQDEQLYQLLQ